MRNRIVGSKKRARLDDSRLSAVEQPLEWGGIDVFTRRHALTKADNPGLGLVVLGFLPQAGSWEMACNLVLIRLAVLLGSATACHLLAQAALERGIRPWLSR